MYATCVGLLSEEGASDGKSGEVEEQKAMFAQRGTGED
jgi:hypothetical protein